MIKPTLCNQKLIYEHILSIKKNERLKVDSNTRKNSYTTINPTNTSVYLNEPLGLCQINIRKIFPEVINVSY